MDIQRLRYLAGLSALDEDSSSMPFVATLNTSPMSQTGQNSLGQNTLGSTLKNSNNTMDGDDSSDNIDPSDPESDEDEKPQDDNEETNKKKVQVKNDKVYNVVMKDPSGKFVVLSPDNVDEPALSDMVITSAEDILPIGESIIYTPMPKAILKSLKDAIAEQRKNEQLYKDQDDRASLDFASNLRKAMEVVLHDLEQEDVEGLKRAQIDLNKLMSPMVFLFPQDVRLYIANGGKTNSLSDKFKLTKTQPYEDKGDSSNHVGKKQTNFGGGLQHDD
jgi:hypothetical protein